MGRNKLIYALADLTVVVAADTGGGGTWTGADEALRRGVGRVAVWRGDGEGPGNAALESRGAVAIRSAAELDDKMVDRIESGDGVCVGRPSEPNDVRIIKISDMAFNDLSETTDMPFGMPGEIIVAGPTCTDSYWERDSDTAMAKMTDQDGKTWHRMGDVGMLDGQGRLWYCGRVSQRIDTGKDVLFADQCEAIFNQHPDLVRSAVVGVGTSGRQTPVLCIEVKGKLSPVDTERVHFDLLQLAQAHSITREIRTVLFHPGFPVDIRHNSKIGREELAVWSAKKMKS